MRELCQSELCYQSRIGSSGYLFCELFFSFSYKSGLYIISIRDPLLEAVEDQIHKLLHPSSFALLTTWLADPLVVVFLFMYPFLYAMMTNQQIWMGCSTLQELGFLFKPRGLKHPIIMFGLEHDILE